jgi:hypothetical protein
MTHTDNPNVSPQDHPRKFHEVFMLRAAEQGEGMQPKVSAAWGWGLVREGEGWAEEAEEAEEEAEVGRRGRSEVGTRRASKTQPTRLRFTGLRLRRVIR